MNYQKKNEQHHQNINDTDHTFVSNEPRVLWLVCLCLFIMTWFVVCSVNNDITNTSTSTTSKQIPLDILLNVEEGGAAWIL